MLLSVYNFCNAYVKLFCYFCNLSYADDLLPKLTCPIISWSSGRNICLVNFIYKIFIWYLASCFGEGIVKVPSQNRIFIHGATTIPVNQNDRVLIAFNRSSLWWHKGVLIWNLFETLVVISIDAIGWHENSKQESLHGNNLLSLRAIKRAIVLRYLLFKIHILYLKCFQI